MEDARAAANPHLSSVTRCNHWAPRRARFGLVCWETLTYKEKTTWTFAPSVRMTSQCPKKVSTAWLTPVMGPQPANLTLWPPVINSQCWEVTATSPAHAASSAGNAQPLLIILQSRRVLRSLLATEEPAAALSIPATLPGALVGSAQGTLGKNCASHHLPSNASKRTCFAWAQRRACCFCRIWLSQESRKVIKQHVPEPWLVDISCRGGKLIYT